MQTSSTSQQLLELTTQASLSSQQATTLASILATLAASANLSQTSSILTGGDPAVSVDQPVANLLSEAQMSAISEEAELKLLNFPSRREDLSTAIPLTVIFALLLVTGCIGNICTAIVIARPKNRYMHTATNYYLFSLAMSDFLFLILGLPQEMYTLWQRYPYAFGESFCIIRGYLSEASTYASILTISAFTVERYVAICHPLWAHTMSQLPRAITSIVIIWCLAAVCAIPPAAELGIVTQRGPLTNRTLEESAQCATKRTIYENMFVVSAIVFFIVPMVIVTVLYILIAIELRRSSRMNNAISKQTSSHLHSQQSTTMSNNNNNNNISHKSHHHCCHNYNHRHHNHHHHPPHHHHQHHQHHMQHNHAEHDFPKTKSQQRLLEFGEQRSAAADDKQAKSPQGGGADSLCNESVLSERPQSAIGNERDATNCCPLAAGGGIHHHQSKPSKSSINSSLARLQFPSKLCSQLLGAGFWSGYNLTATSNDQDADQIKRPESAISCQQTMGLNGDAVVASQEKLPAAASETTERHGAAHQGPRHVPVSRQHSPLSYHESLIQRGGHHHHSAFDMSRLPANGIVTDCHRTAARSLHQPPHHQLSLTQLPSGHQQRQLLLHHQHNFKSFQASHHQHQQQQHSSRRSNPASSKKSVIRMLVAVVVSFFICWVPFHAQRLLASYLVKYENQNQLLLDIYLKLTYISGVMYYLSSTINPLLYQLMSAKFRQAFKDTFKCSLFKCAIFRRASTATTATATALGFQHSPTNSIRNEPRHIQACHCQSAAARAHFICGSSDSRTATPTATSGPHQKEFQHQPLDGSRADLEAADPAAAASHPEVSCEQQSRTSCRGLARCQCCCCCCCQTGAFHQHHQMAPLATSVLGRFRGQLNASLTSLLKFSLLSQPHPQRGDEHLMTNNNCACYTHAMIANSQSSCPLDVSRPKPGKTSAGNPNSRQGEKRPGGLGHFVADSRSCSSLGGTAAAVTACNNAPINIDGQAPLSTSVHHHHQRAPNYERSSSGLSRRDEQQQRRHGSREQSLKSFGGLNSNDDGQLSPPAASLQSNFPAHHTMLKFIRSPTPSSLGNGQLPASLTRLSSREEDDDDDDDVNEPCIDKHGSPQTAPPRPPNDKHYLNGIASSDRMQALIKPMKRSDDAFCLQDGQDESDPLVSTLTSGDSSNGASGAPSSVGSSPDQLASMSQSTNQTRTMSTSSSSSLALLASSNRESKPIMRNPLNGQQTSASSKQTKRNKLTVSNSVASQPAADSKPRQHHRRSSLQQNQIVAGPTCAFTDQPPRAEPAVCQLATETTRTDQNGNEQKQPIVLSRESNLYKQAPVEFELGFESARLHETAEAAFNLAAEINPGVHLMKAQANNPS